MTTPNMTSLNSKVLCLYGFVMDSSFLGSMIIVLTQNVFKCINSEHLMEIDAFLKKNISKCF